MYRAIQNTAEHTEAAGGVGWGGVSAQRVEELSSPQPRPMRTASSACLQTSNSTVKFYPLSCSINSFYRKSSPRVFQLQVKMYGIHWGHFQLVEISSNSDSDFCPKWSWTLVCCRTTKAWKPLQKRQSKAHNNQELTSRWSKLKWETGEAAGKGEVSTKIEKEVLELLKQRGQKGEAILELPKSPS